MQFDQAMRILQKQVGEVQDLWFNRRGFPLWVRLRKNQSFVEKFQFVLALIGTHKANF